MLVDQIDAMYLRLSLEDDEVVRGELEESISIVSQRACINEYVRTHENVPCNLTEFVDDGHSGTSMERPSMKRLLELVYMGRIRTIIVRDLSRFARNYLEAGHYLEYVFPAYGVRFISINDDYDSASLEADSKAFEIAIRNLLNEWYSKDISRKIKTAVDIKKLNGEYVYGTAPFGYRKGEKNNTIVVDPVAAEVVRRIFKSAVNGMTISQIAKMLNEEKVTTPSVYLSTVRSRKYKTYEYWSFDSVKNILINRIYTGDTEPFKSKVIRVGSNRVKMIPEEERIVIPDTHESIISREMFYQARLVIKSNKKVESSGVHNVLSGYLTCGCCGHKLTKGRQTNKNWLCATARYTDELECKDIRLNEAKLKEKLLSAIKLQCKVADAKIETSRFQQSKDIAEMDSIKWDLRKAERSLDEYKDYLVELLDQYYDGKKTKEQFLKEKTIINDKEAALRNEVEKLQDRYAELKKSYNEQVCIESDAGKVNKYREINELNAEIMRELVDSITVYPNNAVQIQWAFGGN